MNKFILVVIEKYRKHKDVLRLILIPPVSILIYWLVGVLILKINTHQIFSFLLFYTILISVSYPFLSKSQKNKINQHQVYCSLLGILLPLIVFFSQIINEENKQSIKTEIFLKEENNRNSSYLQDIVINLTNDPSTIFWRDFSVNSYIQYWDYIQLTKSSECRDLYANLTIQLGALNNINKMRQQFILIPNSLAPKMLEGAVLATTFLNKIVGNCQKI